MMGQFDNLGKKYKERMLFIAKASSIEAGNQVIQNSPVDTGAFKASWMGAIGEPSKAISRLGLRDASIELEISLSDLGIGDVFYLTNAQPYALRLEYGWSAQAPGGIIRRPVAMWDQIVAKKTEESKAVFR